MVKTLTLKKKSVGKRPKLVILKTTITNTARGIAFMFYCLVIIIKLKWLT